MATVVLPESTRVLYPFKSHYLTLSDGKRMHYLDEGPEDGPVLVFVHGYPTWSFTYRAFIVYYAALGFRCLAMDHIGCGLSDKPTLKRYHTPERHGANLIECLDALKVQAITLVIEGWGGPPGLYYAVRRPSIVQRLVILNAWTFQETFQRGMRALVRLTTLPLAGEVVFGMLNPITITQIIQRATRRQMTGPVLMGYRAPFRDPRSRTALYQFPRMLDAGGKRPTTALMRQIEQALPLLRDIPALIVWGEDDPLFPRQIGECWKTMLPRARGPVLIRGGHFLTEDAPELVMRQIDAFIEQSPDQAVGNTQAQRR